MSRRLGKLARAGAAASRRLRLFGRSRDGAASIEYALLGPVYLAMMMGVFELAAISMSMTSVKVGLDDVGRAVRTGQQQCLTDDDVKQMVCASALISSCESDLDIKRARFAGGAGVSAVEVEAWSDLNAEDIVLIDANYDWPIMNPMLAPFLGDSSGNVKIRGAVVFKNESFSNVSCP